MNTNTQPGKCLILIQKHTHYNTNLLRSKISKSELENSKMSGILLQKT